MTEGLIESLVLRSTGIVVAQVPFAVHAGRVAARLEGLGEGQLAALHDRAAHDGMPDTRAGRIAPGHQRRPCR